MRLDWDRRARENSRFYIVDSRTDWSEEEFYESGNQTVKQYILNDMTNVCQGKDPGSMRALELGCGSGRVTRALASIFGSVHGVDVSGEMIRLATRALTGSPNACVHQNNGQDLTVLGDLRFDFAFSTAVFHHIPSKEIIESYIREVGMRLEPGSLFKFEVQGFLGLHTSEDDTWLGSPFSEAEMLDIAQRCGFEARHRVGVGEERFWLWFFKR